MSINVNTFKQQLQQLVATPSVSCSNPALDQSNLGVLNLLANWLEALGFRCELQKVAGYTDKANLIAIKGSGSGGLVLAGHSDTVPFDEGRWQQDPFALTEKHDRLYGLGSTDMKGFFPVVLAALEKLKDADLQAPLILLATADEESSMNGARALTQSQLLNPKYAVIGEPTGLKPIRMHKGISFERIEIIGQSGHSSNPDLGNNAIEAMHQVIASLLKYRAEMQARYQNPGFAVPSPTLNLGCVHGGDNPNRICGACELQFDLRLLPGISLDDTRAELQKKLQPIAEKLKTKILLTPIFPGVDAFEEKADAQLVKLAEKLSGHDAESVMFATEAPFLQTLGAQTVVMGPGSIEQAHQPNEYIELSQIPKAIQIVESLVKSTCVND